MSIYAGNKKIAGLYRGEDVEHATETHAGIIEIATNEEVKAGVDDLKAVTPLKLTKQIKPIDDRGIDTRNELERVKNDILETGEASDSYIHLEDSTMAEFQELEVEGVRKQTTTTGKNLFKPFNATKTFGGITATVSNGEIRLTGTATTLVNQPLWGSFSETSPTLFELKKGTYTFSGMGEFNGDVRINVVINGTGTGIYGSRSITFDEDVNVTGVFMLIKSGQTVDITFKPQCELGTVATDYESYTGGIASPNPDYQQPISVIEDSIKITSCNKNLLSYIEDFEETTLGITTKQTKGIYSLKGTTSSVGDILTEKKLKSYTIKNGDYLHLGNNVAENRLALVLLYSDGTKKSFGLTRANTIYNLTEFVGKTINGIRIYCNTAGIELSLEIKPMISTNSNFEQFEEHLESQIEIDLGDEFIGKIDNTYKDTLKVVYKEEDANYHLILNKKVRKVVFNGDETWSVAERTSTSNGVIVTSFSPTIYDINTVISNYATSVGWASKVGQMDFHYGQVRFYAPTNTITVNEWKQKISENNIIMYAGLKIPYEVDLGVIDMPIAYDEVTNIFTNSDLLPTINVKYYRDFHKSYANLEARLTELERKVG